MKDASGATVMDPATQVTSLHGDLDARRRHGAVRVEPVPRRPARAERPQRQQARQRRDRGPRQPARRSDPGRRRRRARRRQCAQRRARRGRQHPGPAPGRPARCRPRRTLLDLFLHRVRIRWTSDRVRRRRGRAVADRHRAATRGPPAMLAALEARGAKSVFVRYLRKPRRQRHGRRRAWRRLRSDARLGAAAAQAHQPAHRTQPALVPGALRHADRRRGARRAARGRQLLRRARTTSCSAPGPRPSSRVWRSPAGRPGEAELFSYQVLLGLLLSNGPGTISAQGAKGAVSADGPETPGAGADQQGDGRVPHPHRLQPRRQRLRGHPAAARAVRRTSAWTTRASRPRARSGGHGDQLCPGLQAGEDAAARDCGRWCARHPRRQSSGVPRQADQHRSRARPSSAG